MGIRGDFYLDSEEFIIMTIGIIEDDRLLKMAMTLSAHIPARKLLLQPRIIRICGLLISAFRMETVLIYTGN